MVVVVSVVVVVVVVVAVVVGGVEVVGGVVVPAVVEVGAGQGAGIVGVMAWGAMEGEAEEE